MTDLRDLYQEIILDHYKKPRNYRGLEGDGACHVDGHNPLCGDKLTVFVRMNGNVVDDVSFMGSGCAISTASASIMTEALKGKSRTEAEALFGTFMGLVTGHDPASLHGPRSLEGGEADLEEYGSMAVLAGVREFPARVKCATLAWHTAHAALAQAADGGTNGAASAVAQVTTE